MKPGDWVTHRDKSDVLGVVFQANRAETVIHLVSTKTPEHTEFLILTGQDGKAPKHMSYPTDRLRKMRPEELHINQHRFHMWRRKRGMKQ